MTEKRRGVPEQVAELLAQANAQQAMYGNPETPVDSSGHAAAIDDGESAPRSADTRDVDDDVVYYCAGLDHSDTDNAVRLKAHFGDDLIVIAQEKARAPFYAVWTGTHWDIANGGPKALAIAQKLGGRIALETRHIRATESERFAIEARAEALKVPDAERTPQDRNAIAAGEKARDSLAKRVKRRMDHAVSSKNSGRLASMLSCLAPHIMRSPDDLNADDWRFATANVTIRFERQISRLKNPKYISEGATPNVLPEIDKCTGSRISVHNGHRRSDLITHLIPVEYDPNAACPAWSAFIAWAHDDPAVRRLIQVSSGLALIGIPVQKLFFHYGNGANGKSVYMEVLCRLLGESAVTLPATSFIGEGGASGGASPDLARLYGRRLLRVKELPEGEDLKENLVKEVTGGETVTARDLFAGYMDFKPHFVALMSGNGYPRITGTDEGIWRRMAVIPWSKTVPRDERREFEEMVESFRPEFPGILNWLIEGVHIFLRDGLVIPGAVDQATQDYRDDMDRTAGFVTRWIIKNELAEPIQAKDLYAAYCADTVDQGGKPMNNTAFGRAMTKKFRKQTDGRVSFYCGIELRDGGPAASPPQRNPYDPGFQDDYQ